MAETALKPTDLVYLPCTPEMIQAGIHYACRSLAHTYDRMGGSSYDRLRRIVVGKAVEFAFRRYLHEENIPYDNLGATPFTDPDRYDIALGGRRCDLKSFLIPNRRTISRIRRDPSYLMQASALVPVDQVASSHLDDDDLYIFAFMTALQAVTPEDIQAAAAKNQPLCFIHILPSAWSMPAQWGSLGKLVLKANTGAISTVEIGGQSAGRQFLTESVYLAPRVRTEIKHDFYSVAYLYITHIPEGEIGIYSPALKESVIIRPQDWQNIWVYGMDIILSGYVTRSEFRHTARYLPAGSRVLQYPRTRTPNLSIPLTQLHPLSNLFDKVKEWAASR